MNCTDYVMHACDHLACPRMYRNVVSAFCLSESRKIACTPSTPLLHCLYMLSVSTYQYRSVHVIWYHVVHTTCRLNPQFSFRTQTYNIPVHVAYTPSDTCRKSTRLAHYYFLDRFYVLHLKPRIPVCNDLHACKLHACMEILREVAKLLIVYTEPQTDSPTIKSTGLHVYGYTYVNSACIHACIVARTTAAEFEAARLTPADFESAS
jgi:hypothetical protein